MINTNQDTHNESKKNGMKPGAIIAGAVVGASIAVAASTLLKDKKNQDKVKKVLNNVKNQAMDYVDDVQKRASEKKKVIEDQLEDERNHFEKKNDDSKDLK